MSDTSEPSTTKEDRLNNNIQCLRLDNQELERQLRDQVKETIFQIDNHYRQCNKIEVERNKYKTTLENISKYFAQYDCLKHPHNYTIMEIIDKTLKGEAK